MRRSSQRRLRSLLVPGTLLLLLLLALVPAGMLVAVTSTLLLLPTVVLTHYRLEAGSSASSSRRPPALPSPLAVALALTIVVVIGSLFAITLALLLTAILKLGGDGRPLLETLLAIFALLPCLSIGARCGRWWAFSGSLILIPVAATCVLVVGQGFSPGLLQILLVVGLTGLLVAVGSLQRRLNVLAHASRIRTARRPSRPARAEPSEDEPLPVQPAESQLHAKKRGAAAELA